MVDRSDPFAVSSTSYVDADGRDCLGIWAEEGGVLLGLRREANGGVSFHVINTTGLPHLGPATLATFRHERIRAFLAPGSAHETALAAAPVKLLNRESGPRQECF